MPKKRPCDQGKIPEDHKWGLAGFDIYKCIKCGKVVDRVEDVKEY